VRDETQGPGEGGFKVGGFPAATFNSDFEGLGARRCVDSRRRARRDSKLGGEHIEEKRQEKEQRIGKDALNSPDTGRRPAMDVGEEGGWGYV